MNWRRLKICCNWRDKEERKIIVHKVPVLLCSINYSEVNNRVQIVFDCICFCLFHCVDQSIVRKFADSSYDAHVDNPTISFCVATQQGVLRTYFTDFIASGFTARWCAFEAPPNKSVYRSFHVGNNHPQTEQTKVNRNSDD